MPKLNLKGMGVALITPFKTDGNVDYDSLISLIDYQINNGINYLVILGTTAETPTLSADEKEQIIAVTIKTVAGRVPIILGEGSNNTAELVAKIKKTDFKGIDGILSIAPYYNKPSQEGIYLHFKALAEASPVPIILYNHPGRTGVNMSAETTLRLAKACPNIVAIKEASGNIAQIDFILKNKPEGFEVISGDDALAFPLISMGAAGIISVVGNALPKEFGDMVQCALNGDHKTALMLHQNLSEMYDLMVAEGNPAGVKALLFVMNHIENVLRLPLIPASNSLIEQIKEVFTNLNINAK